MSLNSILSVAAMSWNQVYIIEEFVFALPSAPVKGGGFGRLVAVVLYELLVFAHLISALCQRHLTTHVRCCLLTRKNSHDFRRCYLS